MILQVELERIECKYKLYLYHKAKFDAHCTRLGTRIRCAPTEHGGIRLLISRFAILGALGGGLVWDPKPGGPYRGDP